jgi:MFS family permease
MRPMSRTSFQRVFAADVVSTFGSLMSRLAIPWLAVLLLDASPTAMAWLAVADVAAGALAAPLLGVLVDRWPARRTMIACDLARAVALLAIPLLAWSGALSITALVAIVAFNGALSVAFELAQSVWIARNTASDDLAPRNSALAAGGAATEAASFGLTGWIYQWLGGVAAIVVDAISYLLSAILLVRVVDAPRAVQKETPQATQNESPPAEQTEASSGTGAWQRLLDEARDGIAALGSHPTLRALAQIEALTALGMSFASTSYMIYVARDLGFSTGVLGMIFALGGIGSLVGAWATARLTRRFGSPKVLVGGLAIWAVGSACAPLAASASVIGALLLILQQVVGDSGATASQISDRTLRQSHAPADRLARVDAGIRTIGYACTLGGALLGGALAEIFGARALLFASSAIVGLAALLAAWRLRSEQVLAI